MRDAWIKYIQETWKPVEGSATEYTSPKPTSYTSLHAGSLRVSGGTSAPGLRLNTVLTVDISDESFLIARTGIPGAKTVESEARIPWDRIDGITTWDRADGMFGGLPPGFSNPFMFPLASLRTWLSKHVRVVPARRD